MAILAAFAFWIYTAPAPPKPSTGLEKLQVHEAVERALKDVTTELGSHNYPTRASARNADASAAVRWSTSVATRRTAPPKPATSEATDRVSVAKDRLVAWARRSLRITFERTCPPKESGASGDYSPANRRIRMCPDLEGLVALDLTAHEVAHALQHVRGRLGRVKGLEEPEADVTAIVALRAAGFGVAAKGRPYLDKLGDRLEGILASREAIEGMALTLAQVMRGERVTR